MELGIKHFAAYLPYDVKFTDGLIIYELDSENLAGVINDSKYLNNIKLHLRPLSDLTKEITINGETFVPYDVIEARFPESKYTCVVMDNGIIEMSFWDEYQKLLEWHFDIYGLISAGLAIDINTLNE